jgi:hypothetical protein
MAHLTAEQITDFTLSAEFPLDDESFKSIQSHLDECPECAAIYQRMKKKYEEVSLPDAQSHIKYLNEKSRTKKKRKHLLMIVGRSAAVILMMFVVYRATAWMMNRQFDNSEIGLADLEKDYLFALKQPAYRGAGVQKRDDIEWFKAGVRTMFNAKKTTFGVMPFYEMDSVNLAGDYFDRAEKLTTDETLKERIAIFQERIKKVKKEVKK